VDLQFDLVLSGDNAVVIGMAAHRLPPRQRRFAILFGAGAAIVLRIGLTAIATMLLLLPWIRLIGGGLLLWIGVKLLKEEEEVHEGTGGSERLIEAISTIVIADVVMSVDNILGVAAAAHGDIGLLIFGLVLSMIIMLAGGSLIANMIDKFWWLVYLGSAVILWTGAEMMFGDQLVVQQLGEHHPLVLPATATITVVLMVAAHYFHRHRPKMRRLSPRNRGTGKARFDVRGLGGHFHAAFVMVGGACTILPACANSSWQEGERPGGGTCSSYQHHPDQSGPQRR
jgi:YjbE family integral membrane protein